MSDTTMQFKTGDTNVSPDQKNNAELQKSGTPGLWYRISDGPWTLSSTTSIAATVRQIKNKVPDGV